jgi:PilZ domain
MRRKEIGTTRKERRRDRRRPLQLEARLGGQDILVTDLSAAGFGAAVDATDPRPYGFRAGQRLRLELLPKGHDPIELSVEIMRPEGENGIVGGVFVGITDATYALIEGLLTGRFSRRR